MYNILQTIDFKWWEYSKKMDKINDKPNGGVNIRNRISNQYQGISTNYLNGINLNNLKTRYLSHNGNTNTGHGNLLERNKRDVWERKYLRDSRRIENSLKLRKRRSLTNPNEAAAVAVNVNNFKDIADEKDLSKVLDLQEIHENIMTTTDFATTKDFNFSHVNENPQEYKEVLKVNKNNNKDNNDAKTDIIEMNENEDIADNDEEDEKDEDDDKLLKLKSNYDNKQQTLETPAEDKSIITSTIKENISTTRILTSFTPSLTSSSTPTPTPAPSTSASAPSLDNDDKTLKINNILNLNQSNKHNINKEDFNHNNLKENQQNIKDIKVFIPLEEEPEHEQEADIEYTTKLYTIFENYNYDEEEEKELESALIEDLNLDLLAFLENDKVNFKEIDSFNTPTTTEISTTTLANNDNQNDNDDITNNLKTELMSNDDDSSSQQLKKNDKQISKIVTETSENHHHHHDKNHHKTVNDKTSNISLNKKQQQINDLQMSNNKNSMTLNSQQLNDSYDDKYLTLNDNKQNKLDFKEILPKPLPLKANPKEENSPESLENLMLNDGLHNYELHNFQQHLDDIDIVKLEQTHSNEEELYKTINVSQILPKEKLKKSKFPQNSFKYDKHLNEVLLPLEDKQQEEEELELSKHYYEKPITSAPPLIQLKPPPAAIPSIALTPEHNLHVNSDNSNDKRIIVNLTIASNDGSGNTYSLHVNIPAFDQSGQVQNMQQVLTHEHLPTQEISAPQENKDSIKTPEKEDYKTSPYCIPEPPPPIPECPCACGLFPETTKSSLNTLDPDSDLDQDWYQIPSTTKTSTDSTLPSSITNSPHTTINAPANNGVIANDFTENYDFVTTTSNANAKLDVITETNINVLKNSNENNSFNDNNNNGEKFACPDVMPILILEGDLYNKTLYFFCFQLF